MQTSGAVVAQYSGCSHSIMFYTVTLQSWEFPRVLWSFFVFYGGGLTGRQSKERSGGLLSGPTSPHFCPIDMHNV